MRISKSAGEFYASESQNQCIKPFVVNFLSFSSRIVTSRVGNFEEREVVGTRSHQINTTNATPVTVIVNQTIAIILQAF
jgi:hypothetical protein